MRTRFTVLGHFLVLAVLAHGVSTVALSTVALSQWRVIANLPSLGNTVYFLDKVGAPATGFVGCRSDIVRTSDRGATWVTVQNTPGITFRDFVFWDTLNGI